MKKEYSNIIDKSKLKEEKVKNSKSKTLLNFKNKDKKILMLIDSHALLHRGYHAMAGFATRDGRPTGALFGFLKMIINARNLVEPNYVIACYDLPKPTFRHLAYEEYKGKRSGTDEDLKIQINQSKDFCKALSIPVLESEGFEADDLLGTIAEKYKDRFNIVIVSGDMDTLQLVDDNVRVCTLKKGSEISIFGEKEVFEKYELTPEQIPDYKGLSGDTSDNIRGVRNVGPKTAVKILKEWGSVENFYENLKEDEESVLKIVKGKIFENLKEGEEDAIFSKTLATIRRDATVDSDLLHNLEKDDPDELGFNINEVEYERLCNLYELHSLKKVFSKNLDEIVASISKGVKSKKNVNIDLSDGVDIENPLEESSKVETEEVNIDNKKETVSEKELAELQVMSLLLESEYINPAFEKIKEIFNFQENMTFEECKTILVERLIENNLFKYYKTFEEPLFEILNDMKNAGVLVDREELKKQKEFIVEKIKNLEKEIYEIAGEEFLISSPKQLGNILYDKLNLGTKIKKTAGGQRSTNAEMLEKIKDEHIIVSKILLWREISKVYNTYLEPLENYILEDKKIHPHFLQTGASTGRFSCENPNMQNLPRNSELGQAFRKVFVVEKNKIFVSADYSQIDLRSAAILSKDTKLQQIFKEGITDIHRGVAAQVLGKNLQDITDDERRKAKAINFGILYGMGVNALKDAMGSDRATAQEFFDNFKNTFFELMNYLERVKSEATKRGYTTTLFGRRRNIPLLKSHLPFMRAQGERIAINAPVQGTSADILKLGMIKVFNRLKDDIENNKIKMILQIHDELVFECDEIEKDFYAKIIKEEMENVLKDKNLLKDLNLDETNIPLLVNISFGKSLYDL